MTFDDLELFWALAERKSITEAGRAVAMSQPTASRRLKAMEQELGNPLVERTTYPLSLTPYGILFLDFADDVLKRYRALLFTASQNHSVIGRLTLATSSSPASRLVTRWMADFIMAEPGVRVDLWEMNTREVEHHIAQGDVDIGFMGLGPTLPELVSFPIAEDEIILVVPHRLSFPSKHKTQDWSALQTLPFVIRRKGSGTQEVVFNALLERGWARPSSIVLEVDTAFALLDAVESGLGAGFVSRELLFRRTLNNSSPVSIKGLSLKRPFYLTYHPENAPQDPVAYQFLRYASMRMAQMKGPIVPPRESE